jgi:hypothetical protein
MSDTQQSKFYFKCTANPNAPVLVLDTYWEAEEMRTHPDYVRVDEHGDLVIDAERDNAPHRFPLVADAKPAAATPKRAKLGLPKK